MLIHILFRSMIAVPFICLILGLRAAVRRFPRKYIYVFWLLLLVELIFPFTIESRWGLLPAWMAESEEITLGDHGGELEPAGWNPENGDWDITWSDGADTGTGFYKYAEAPAAVMGETDSASLTGTEAVRIQQGEVKAYNSLALTGSGGQNGAAKAGTWYAAVRLLWSMGAAALFFLYLLKLYHVKRQVRFAVVCREPGEIRINGENRRVRNLWETPGLHSAFILPGLPSRIYLPADLEKKEREDILAHEYQHIRQLHPWIKLFSSAVLVLHWFNPFVWLAVKCMTQDMEMICDEAVLQGRDLEDRKRYAATLLKCAARRNGLDLCLAFGESNTHKRIRHLVQLKKAKWILPMGLAVAAALCIPAFFTVRAEEGKADPGRPQSPEDSQAVSGNDQPGMESLNGDTQSQADILGYWGYTGYMDECVNYSGYDEFVNQDYDRDGRTDRVWRQETVQEDGSTEIMYRVEFGSGDMLTVDGLENDGIPDFQSGDLTGDGKMELLFTQSYSYGTDPMGFGEMAVYVREESGYVRQELPFLRQDDFAYSEFVSLSYNRSFGEAFHVSCKEAAWEGIIEVPDELWNQAQYYQYDGETFLKCIWNAQIMPSAPQNQKAQGEEAQDKEGQGKEGQEAQMRPETGSRDKLVCRTGIFDKWSEDELVITLAYEEGTFQIEEIVYEGDALIAEGEADALEKETSSEEVVSSDYPLKDYREPQLHYYLPKHYEGDALVDTGDKTTEYYEALARKALRELYQLTGTQLEECCYYYTNLASVHFGMTQEDLERGRTFYDHYYNVEGEHNIIESLWIASARQTWYSPVDQYKLPSDYESMSDEKRAEWFLMQSGNYNGQAVVSAYQPYSYSEETWRLVMEDGTAYEMSLNNDADTVTDITGPYPDANIVH